MEDLMKVASYICTRYEDENGKAINEMKLQGLLYMAQRESLIQNGEPLFNGIFYGWRFGPLLKEIHLAFKEHTLNEVVPQDVVDRMSPIMDKVFTQYSHKDPWSLSRLTLGELSWKNSRIGVPDDVSMGNPMKLEDIREDARRIKERREILSYLGLI